MAARRGLAGLVIQEVERRLDVAVIPADERRLAEQAFTDLRATWREMDLLGYSILDYFSGNPSELRPESRRSMAKKSLTAWMVDAQAYRAVELLIDFAFGRGVPQPRAKSRAVQRCLEDFWNDPVNKVLISSAEGQRKLARDLIIQPLDPDTEIRMADGSSKELRDVVAGEMVVTHTGAFARVTENRDAGIQERFRLTTAEGRTVIGAGSHPFLTAYREWQRLDELEVAEELVREPRVEGLVAEISPDEARLLGYFVGDGSCSGSNAAFNNADPLLIADFTAAAERMGWRVTKDGYGKYAYGVAGGVRSWLRKHGVAGKTAHQKRVPSAVMRAPNHLVAEFLRGYFAADGCVSGEHVFVSSVSRKLVEDVQHLLARLGVRSAIRLSDAPSRQGKSIWVARVYVDSQSVFLDQVDPLGRKGELLRLTVAARPERRAIACAGSGQPVCTVLGCGRLATHTGLCGKHYAHQRRWGTTVTARSESPHDRVVTIEPVGAGPVRCLAVDHEDHSYVANGVVTHNSNVFPLIFDDGDDGKVQVSLLAHDAVESVVRDDDNRLMVLYYTAREKKMVWDYKKDRYVPADATAVANPPVTYYEHWANVAALKDEDGKVPAPDSGRIGKGKVYHLVENSTSEMSFGVPMMNRTMRWFAAYNDIQAARVDMMKAAASFIMKRKIQGTPNQLAKMASRAISRESPLAAGMDYGAYPMAGRPASILNENQMVDHEPLKLDTGSAQAVSDADMLHGQIAAGTGLPKHYLGSSDANLATATAMELFVIKRVEAFQEIFESFYRALFDMVIERAEETGLLDQYEADEQDEKGQGDEIFSDEFDRYLAGLTAEGMDDETLAMAKRVYLRLREDYEDQTADESATGRDLSYDFSMPSPLRRVMSDLVTAVQVTAQTFDPNNTNTELSRALLAIVFGEAFEMDDPASLVERVLPPGYVDPMLSMAMEQQQGAGAAGGGGGAPAAPAPQWSGAADVPAGAGNSYGAPMKATAPEDVPGTQESTIVLRRRDGRAVLVETTAKQDERVAVTERGHAAEVEDLYDAEVAHRAADALERAAAVSDSNGNGHGSGA